MTLQQFLTLMVGDLQNEWTHLQFYLYHASAMTGLHAHEYKELFTASAKSELAHVQAFLDRLFGLNVEMPPASGHDFPRFTAVEHALSYAIKLEQDVVENYSKRLLQLDEMAGAHPSTAAYLKVFYEDQLQDSYEDCEHLRRLTHDLLPSVLDRARDKAT